jgi:hypothetical protein
MNTRNWSIRSKIIALVAVPLSALLALWIFATVLTVGPAFNLLSARTLLDTVGTPGEVLVADLQRERRLSVVYLSAKDGDGSALATQRSATDRSVAEFRSAASSDDAHDAASDLLRDRITQIFAALDGLPTGRGYIDRREIDAAGAQDLFNDVVNTAFKMFAATATFNDPRIDREIRALTTVGRGREWLSQADSLLAGAQAAGTFTGGQLGQLIEAIGTQRFLYSDAIADLPTDDRATYQRLVEGDAFVRLRQMQDALVLNSRTGAAPPVQAKTWQPAYDSAVQQLRAFELGATESLAGRAAPVAVGILLRLALAGILGLTAVVVSVLVSLRVGRSLIGRLIQLRADALRMADERLPAVVRRLQRGESVDVEAEAPPLEYGDDEIGQLGRAFTEVQRTAVQSAVDEASVRRGLNEVFLNIARRSQTLLHRQLALLDRMERRETEPQELEDLYRVDHLATRMRRHAEDLVILAGAAPGRGWRNPVPVVDVIRGAISEVEDYKRIDVSAVETSSVVGRAVGDVIHLLAELLENAASFSPPHTRVHVAGQVVPNGYAVEIEDRGLGMSAEAIADANRRLLEPPDFDPGDSARLGLFVVARLSARNGIRVQLRPSPYGGVTAVALIPADITMSGQGRPALTAGPSGPSGSWAGPTAGLIAPSPNGNGGQGGQGGPPGWPGRHSTVPAQSDGTMEHQPVPITAGPNGASIAAGSVAGHQPAGSTPAAGPTLNGTFSAGPQPPAPDAPVDTAAVLPARPAEDVGLARFSEQVEHRGTSTAAGPVSGAPVRGPHADGLTVDGLAQRRRTVPRPSAPGELPSPIPATVSDPAPANGHAAATSPVIELDDGLPRRVRQANLASQLRQPVVEPVAAAPTRSPDQVRSLMSALQSGTTRGRQAAEAATSAPDGGVKLSPVDWFTDAPPGSGPTPGVTWADAATAGFPVTRDDLASQEPASDGPASDGPASDGPASDGLVPDDLAPDRPAPDDPDRTAVQHGLPEPDEAVTVVHLGEIVPRLAADPDGDPSSRPTNLPTARLGEPAHPDKDA